MANSTIRLYPFSLAVNRFSDDARATNLSSVSCENSCSEPGSALPITTVSHSHQIDCFDYMFYGTIFVDQIANRKMKETYKCTNVRKELYDIYFGDQHRLRPSRSIERFCAGQITSNIRLNMRTEKMARTNPESRTRDYLLRPVDT